MLSAPQLIICAGLTVGFSIIGLIAYRISRAVKAQSTQEHYPTEHSWFLLWPGRWLAIKCNALAPVQHALRLHHPHRCSWLEGMAEAQNLFIAPPVHGWVLVTGGALPDPAEDIDACFHFVVNLSRALGEVQFFETQRFLHHHAWIKARDGRILRAYAWAGETLWNQGRPTHAEKRLGFKCFAYGELPREILASGLDPFAQNAQKVPLLAAAWSFDPVAICDQLHDKQPGVGGVL